MLPSRTAWGGGWTEDLSHAEGDSVAGLAVLLPPPLVLRGPLRILPQLPGGSQGPVGLLEELAPQEYQVGLFTPHDVVGLTRIGDEAYGAGKVRLGSSWPVGGAES